MPKPEAIVTLKINNRIAEAECSLCRDRLFVDGGEAVTGQLLADNGHLNPNDDCSFSGANTTSCWRMSLWELHPVLNVYICRKGVGCGDNGSEWEELDNLPTKAGPKTAHRTKPRD